ncbi:MAG: PhzF family phenazine biosynthesis protein [Synechococcaceae bacterium WB8_1B_136]|nr:PhzF family phenazine biosynthesis protein [Synechococcaceae bacterium WB8_1B_136]
MAVSSPQLPAVLVEAFGAGPLQGNGAAVVLLNAPAADPWMQALAASFKQSETAFLLQLGDGAWALRWFTPSCEVPLCGHATLAATLALGHWGRLQAGQTVTLRTRSGGLAVCLLGNEHSDTTGASLVLPSGALTAMEAPGYLEQLLGCQLEGYWRSGLGYRVALLPGAVPLASVGMLAPELQQDDRQGLVLMQRWSDANPAQPTGHGEVRVLGCSPNYQLRFFAPGLGIDEDPVTGSAHALVAPWWMRELDLPRVVGWQPSSRRGGMICDSPAPGSVRLTGTGHLLWDGHLNAGGMELDPQSWHALAAC